MKKYNYSAKAFSMELKGRQRFLRLFGESSQPRGICSGFVTLKKGESIGKHNTRNKEEALVILQGQADVLWGRRSRLKVKKNCFVYIPPRTEHDVRNTGKGALKYVYLTASP